MTRRLKRKLTDEVKSLRKEKKNLQRKNVFGIVGFLIVVLFGLIICPMQAAAYFGVDEDYLLRTEKPEGRGAGPYHYLEFVSGDTDGYTVQAGDTLWEIARKCYGSGISYEKLWEENRDRIDTPETLQIGTRLDLDKRFYVNVGMQDYIKADVVHERSMSGPNTWEWEADGYPYQIFAMMTYRNDLGEKDPYRQWEAFQREVEDCGRKLCGSRISDLTFERYHVTDVCDLCYYQFVFDGDSGKYLIMAAFVYTGEIENEVFTALNGYGDTLPFSHQYMKNEVFAVCDLDRCGEAELAEAKGKTFYMAARTIDSGCYLPKMADNVGADDWKYPELHNPFRQAMMSFCDEPLTRAETDAGEQEIQWKDPVVEELVREQLAGLWKLTDEERAAFMKRPMTAADLSGVEKLYLYENREEREVFLQLNGYEKDGSSVLPEEENSAEGDRPILTTLDDLAHFTGLRRLDIYLEESDIADFSAVGELTGLRELCLELEGSQIELDNEDIAFLGKLKNLRMLYLYGVDHKKGGWGGLKPTCLMEKITDISVLENCQQLAYLKLTTGNAENYEFLAKLPNLYYIDLRGQDNMLNLRPDTSLMPNACFIWYYGKQIRFDVGGSREIEDDKY